jgi:ATP-dependent DNA helicase RecG
VDLVTLLSRNEGKTLEFKRDLSSPQNVLKAIVAFANTSGGVILLGVEDKTKRVRGIQDVLGERLKCWPLRSTQARIGRTTSIEKAL